MSTQPVEVPPRVVFINVKDGNAFFDCSPAEARMAAKLIKEMRDNGESNLDFIVEFRTSIKKATDAAIAALKTTAKDAPWICSRFTAHLATEGFKKVEENDKRMSHLVMNAVDYADLRMWDRDTLIIETEMWKLKAGVMAIMWGAYIIVSRDMPVGTMMFCGLDDPEIEPEFYRMELFRDSAMAPVGARELPVSRTPLDILQDQMGEVLSLLRPKSK
jgi:hypothetical protein